MVEFYTWADKIAADLKKRNAEKHVVHGMWTPSGYFHIGNARAELLMPGLVFQAVKDANLPVDFNFFVDDFDDLDKIPAGIDADKEKFSEYLGRPMYEVPSPVKGYVSWAEYFTSEIKQAMGSYGLYPTWYSSYENYKNGTYDNAIRIALEKAPLIKSILEKITKAKKPDGWLPAMVICESCGRSATTMAMSWNGETLKYVCNQDREYAKGCGHVGEIIPGKGNVKLPWRVHWPATWATFNVTMESGGKDHFASGGSVETGKAICKQVFDHEPPMMVGIEFIQIDNKKVSGSKGGVISLGQWMEFADPSLLRFLYISYQPNTVINIDVRSQKFFLMTDRYDEAERAFFGEQSTTEKRTEQLKRQYEIAQTVKPRDQPVRISYSMLSMILQVIPDRSPKAVENMLLKMGALKKELSESDRVLLAQRIKYVETWISKYADDDIRIHVNDVPPQMMITDDEKEALKNLAAELRKDYDEEKFQSGIYDIARNCNLEPKFFFKTIYKILINRESGPRLAPFMMAVGKDKARKLFEEAVR